MIDAFPSEDFVSAVFLSKIAHKLTKADARFRRRLLHSFGTLVFSIGPHL